jgi:beta-lactamase regulating signal transducer with metallopeptidase domain
MSEFVLSVVLKATVVLLLAFAVTALARHARASLRHFVYAATFVFLLLLPVATRLMPRVDVAVPEQVAPRVIERQLARTAGQAVAAPSQSKDNAQPRNLGEVVIDIYAAGVALALLSLVTGVVNVRRLASRAEVSLEGMQAMNEIALAANIRRAVLVVVSDEIAVPITFGFRRSTIVLPRAAKTWSADELRFALRHELEHVRRDDWALLLLARVASAVYWPHPLVWAAWRRFCLEAERACDDAVIGAYEGATSYADQLVTLARGLRGRRAVPALAMASPSKLSQRIQAILDPAQRRGPHGRMATVATIVATCAVLLAFAPVQLVAESVRRQVHARFNTAADEDTSIYGEALIRAAASGRNDILAKLFEAGASVNSVMYGDGTPLLIAAKHGHEDTVRWLLDSGADVNLPSEGDGNPLIAAAQEGHVEIAKLLLDRGARIDDVVPGDENPLIAASEAGHEAMVRLLLERGADVNVRLWVDDREWRSPLIMARRFGHENIVKLLTAAGARQ